MFSVKSRPRLLIAALLALLPFVFFYPAVCGQVLLAPSDGWHQNFGVRVLAGRMIAQGMLPLWNPYIFAGTPLLASVYPGAFYPPNWLFAVLPPGPAMNLVVITTFHVALAGAYLFARRTGRSRGGALVAGLVFAFGGFMVAHVSHTSRIAAAAWLPWVLLAVENLYVNARWRWVSLGALFVALQFLAGEPQMLVLTALTGGAYAAFRFFGIKPRAGKVAQASGLWPLPSAPGHKPEACATSRTRFAVYCAAFALAGALVACVQLLPARELHAASGRAVSTYEYFSDFALPPAQLFALVFPYFFGGAAAAPYHTTPLASSFWGPWEYNLATGYVGLTGLLLALFAVFAARRGAFTARDSAARDGVTRSDAGVIFWACVAVVALLFALGPALPFDLNRLLFYVPGLNVFRGHYRHLLEFNFAVAVLAGRGVDALGGAARAKAGARRLAASTLLVAALVTLTAAVYLTAARGWAGAKAAVAPSLTLRDAEAWVPLLMFSAAAGAVWLHARRAGAATLALLVAIVFIDLCSFGEFYVWRGVSIEMMKLVADPPAVAFTKSRERDPASYRVVSHALDPVGDREGKLNQVNLTILRGVQSVNGFDALRLERLAEISGSQTEAGLILDGAVFGEAHRGLDLLNVKYLLREPSAVVEPHRALVHDGVSFGAMGVARSFTPGSRLALSIKPAAATEIALVTALSDGGRVKDGTPVLKIKLRTADGRVIERELLAGRDTAEWSYDRPEFKAIAPHRRARVAESYPLGPEAKGVQGHHYLARLAFESAEIVGVECEYLPAEAGLLVARASLYDARSAVSTQLDLADIAPERWRKLGDFDGVELYENLRQLPRAWLVSRVEARPSAEVLRAVREGRLPDGGGFDPRTTALLEVEDFGSRAVTLPPTGAVTNSTVKVTRYEPHRIELETDNPQPAFLVLSEVYFRGWDATVDGRKSPVYRANYALRGLAVPGGKHRVEFSYRAPSLKTGAVYAGIGLLVLLAGAVVSRVKLNFKSEI
jgi:hypothetical protein